MMPISQFRHDLTLFLSIFRDHARIFLTEGEGKRALFLQLRGDGWKSQKESFYLGYLSNSVRAFFFSAVLGQQNNKFFNSPPEKIGVSVTEFAMLKIM